MSKSIQLRNFLASLAISIIVGIFTYYYTEGSNIPISTIILKSIIYPVLTLLSVYLILSVFISSSIKGASSLFIDAKMRGFLSGEELDREIANKFSESHEIKIKITRAYDLVLEKDTKFSRCFDDLVLLKEPRRIKMLMHFPCMKSPHIKSRAETHHVPVDEFVTTWFDVLEKLLTDINYSKITNTTVQVRFYTEEHDRWRFYIFDGKYPTLFMNYYDVHYTGQKTAMYKVIYGNVSFYNHFSRYFDDVWSSQNDSMEASEYLFKYFARENNKLTQCKDCDCQRDCLKIQIENIERIPTKSSY